MKKTLLAALSIMLIFFISLPAQNSANDAYIKAMNSTDVNQRAKLLKDWVSKYEGQGSQYENFACASLCNEQYKGKTPADIIKYGEKALALEGLDDTTTCQVLLNVSTIYSHQDKSLAKAAKYAGQVVSIANTAKGKESEAGREKIWNQFRGAGYFAQAHAMEKNKKYKSAIAAYSNSYKILKNKQIITTLAQLGQILYKTKSYTNAEAALKIVVPILKDFGSITLYAKTLHRLGNKNEALKYYKQSYSMKKNGEIAYNIGILLAPQAKINSSLADETIQYLLNASFLSPANSKNAMQLAESLYFNMNPEYNDKVKALQAKSKSIEQLTSTFNNKFGEKDEEDLSDAEKKEMHSTLAKIESEHKAIEKLQEEQQITLAAFNQLIEQTKQKLDIK